MLISNSATRALDDIAARERDVLEAYAPGAMPERSDSAKGPTHQAVTDPLSVAAPENAYFITTGADGRMLFTRDGSFSIRAGTLCDAQGRPMLGYARDGAPLSALHADSVDEALSLTAGARIAADGTVSYERSTIDPRTGRREMQQVRMGRIALARFAPGTKLQSVDAQHAAAPAGIPPHAGRAGDGNFGMLTPFARESSGVDIDVSLQRLQEAYLAFDAICAAGKAQGGVQKTAMDLLK